MRPSTKNNRSPDINSNVADDITSLSLSELMKELGVNKNAYIRYQTLDKCFRNPYKIFYLEDLLEEVNKELEYVNGFDSFFKKRQLILSNGDSVKVISLEFYRNEISNANYNQKTKVNSDSL